ncbi:MAG: GGDEF domain-containing protein, partial [Merismopedia sp. SIO2A8]|nr:GGDEF domain-containing protein [Merismopedia sp. SIO2A8]
QELCMILCDIDYFKQFNDTYGHQTGDECLIRVAQVLQKTIRASDFVARYGGEEFVVLLPQTNLAVAQHIAECIRKGVKSLHIPHRTSAVSDFVSLSCGVTYTSQTELQTAKGLLETTDQVLYEAKRGGRDRVVAISQLFRGNSSTGNHQPR